MPQQLINRVMLTASLFASFENIGAKVSTYLKRL